MHTPLTLQVSVPSSSGLLFSLYLGLSNPLRWLHCKLAGELSDLTLIFCVSAVALLNTYEDDPYKDVQKGN